MGGVQTAVGHGVMCRAALCIPQIGRCMVRIIGILQKAAKCFNIQLVVGTGTIDKGCTPEDGARGFVIELTEHIATSAARAEGACPNTLATRLGPVRCRLPKARREGRLAQWRSPGSWKNGAPRRRNMQLATALFEVRGVVVGGRQ